MVYTLTMEESGVQCSPVCRERGVSMPSPESVRPQAPSHDDEGQQERSYTVLGTVLLGILLVVVILMFWRTCDTAGQGDEDQGGGGVISDVSRGMDTLDGGVAIWVKPGESVDGVLSRNGLSDAPYTDLGDGTYVVSIGEQDASAVIERLKDDEALYDAGFLFFEESEE